MFQADPPGELPGPCVGRLAGLVGEGDDVWQLAGFLALCANDAAHVGPVRGLWPPVVALQFE